VFAAGQDHSSEAAMVISHPALEHLHGQALGVGTLGDVILDPLA
jgi:hypothetical protein